MLQKLSLGTIHGREAAGTEDRDAGGEAFGNAMAADGGGAACRGNEKRRRG